MSDRILKYWFSRYFKTCWQNLFERFQINMEELKLEESFASFPLMLNDESL
jgi:hypothetical protein